MGKGGLTGVVSFWMSLMSDSHENFESGHTGLVSSEEVISSLGTNPEKIVEDLTTNPEMLQRLGGSDDQLRNQACVEFQARYQKYIINIVLEIGLNRREAEDIVNTVLEKVYRKIDRFDVRKGRFRNWLWTVAKNTAIDQIRKHPVGVVRLGTNEEAPDEGFEALWRQEEIRFLIETTLARMKADRRIKGVRLKIFREYAVFGKRAKDVARKFQTTENAVRLAKHDLMPLFKETVQVVQQEKTGGGL